MIRAATKLIAKQGFTKTTLAEVGREAGYTGGLVSHHFGSKEGLLHELVLHLAGRFRNDQIEPAISGLDGFGKVSAYVETYLAELEARPGRMRALYVLMGEALGPVPEIRKTMAEVTSGMRRGIRQYIEEGLEDGSVRAGVDPQGAALLVVALLRGVANQRITEPRAVDLSLAREQVQETLRFNLSSD